MPIFRKPALLASVLFAAAFMLRFYAASHVPFIPDEEKHIHFTSQISFAPNKLMLPFGSTEIERGILSAYVTKFDLMLFGRNELGCRFLFVIFGVLGLFFIYKIVVKKLGYAVALLALLFLVLSQYHIGASRLIDQNNLLLFFCALSIFCFFEAIDTGSKKWLIFTGIALGMGYLSKELIVLLLPIFAIFLWIEKERRFWLSFKKLYLMLVVMGVFMLPLLAWAFKNNFCSYASEDIFNLGFSLRSFYLYFAEPVAWFLGKMPFINWDVYDGNIFILLSSGERRLLSGVSSEYPFVHWPFGIMVFLSFLYCLGKDARRNEFIRFCLLMFGFIFIVTSIIAGGHSLLDDHWWASMTIYPGAILCSYTLREVGRKYYVARMLTGIFIIYLLINAFYFIRLLENQFAVPKKELCRYYLKRAETYLSNGEIAKAGDRCRWVLNQCGEGAVLDKARGILYLCNQDSVKYKRIDKR